MKGGVPLFLRPRGLAACDAIFFFTRAQNKRPLLRDTQKDFLPCIPCRAVREASLRLTTSQRAVRHPTVSTRAAMLGKRLRRFLRFSRVPSARDGNALFSRPMKLRHEALHRAAKRKRAAHRNPRLRRITTDATTDTESLRRERDAGPPPHGAARSYHARAQRSRGAIGYDMRTPRRTAMRARDMCSEAAAHTQRPHVTVHRRAEPPPQAPKGSVR